MTTTLMNDYRDQIENDCIRRGQPLNGPYTSRTDTENYEPVRSVTNKWNRQYGDKKMLSEDIIEALIHCINLDNVRNAATKAKRQMALVWLLSCHLWLSLTCFCGRQMENKPLLSTMKTFLLLCRPAKSRKSSVRITPLRRPLLRRTLHQPPPPLLQPQLPQRLLPHRRWFLLLLRTIVSHSAHRSYSAGCYSLPQSFLPRPSLFHCPPLLPRL
jgi:hypothetical protein